MSSGINSAILPTNNLIKNNNLSLAVIDLGTNTFHLLIAKVTDTNKVKELFKLQIPVKLGEGGINNRLITPAAFERGLDALRLFKKEIAEFDTSRVFAYATSAIRSADNGKGFVEMVKEQTGIEINVISGDEEAELIFNGVRHTLTLTEEKMLVMDIGGGSVEFIIANKDTIFWKHSFLLGAARLLEMFHTTDPISIEEQQSLVKYLDFELLPLKNAIHEFPVSTMIGSAGSFESLVEMIEKNLDKKLHFNNSCPVSIDDYHVIHSMVMRSTHEDRMNFRGLIPYRGEMIVMSFMLIEYVLRTFKIQKLIASDYSLKEGALFKMSAL
jgi:exopolyphosphatase/guanosine-5'-triphosphate,3'-diphosphate pyrophosphatase